MSTAGKKLLSTARELNEFADGKNVGPMTLWMPDGAGGLEKREVANIAEYRSLWSKEGLRVIDVACGEPER